MQARKQVQIVYCLSKPSLTATLRKTTWINFQNTQKKDLEVIVEVHTEQEFEEALKSKYDLIGINNRDLDNFHVDITNTEKLLKRYSKAKSTIISESGINDPEDIRHLRSAGADAFLVGTSVMQATDIGAKISDLYYAL